MVPSRPQRIAALPDPTSLEGTVAEFADDEPTQPIDPTQMAAEARRSRYVLDPFQARGLAHCLRPPRPDEPETLREIPPFQFAELHFLELGGTVVLPVRGITNSGVSLELTRGVPLPTAEQTRVDVELCLGHDIWGQPVTGRFPARVAYRRAGTAGRAGGISLRWDLTHAGQREDLERLLTRLKTRRDVSG